MNEPNNQGQNTNNYSRFLPIANIGRIMKKALPENAKIAKDAKQTVQECVSQFISFITSEACQKCKAEKRKTINGQDLLASVDILGFDSYNGLLKLYLKKYRQVVKQSEKGQQLQKEEQQQGNDIDESEEK